MMLLRQRLKISNNRLINEVAGAVVQLSGAQNVWVGWRWGVLYSFPSKQWLLFSGMFLFHWGHLKCSLGFVR
jgi:hypothetical protein